MPRIVLALLLPATIALAGCSGGGAGRGSAPAAMPRATSVPTQSRSGGGVSFMGHDLPFDQVLSRAQATGKPVMLYFSTTWCGYCRKLEQETLPSAAVGEHMAGYINVGYNADNPEGRKLASRYGVSGYPTLVRVDASGAKQGMFEGYDPPSDFVRRVPRP